MIDRNPTRDYGKMLWSELAQAVRQGDDEAFSEMTCRSPVSW